MSRHTIEQGAPGGSLIAAKLLEKYRIELIQRKMIADVIRLQRREIRRQMLVKAGGES
jgi:hypothetical protein